jgi:hypothetical protein
LPVVTAIGVLAWRPRRLVAVPFAVLLYLASALLPIGDTAFATRYPGLDHFAVFPLNALSHLAITSPSFRRTRCPISPALRRSPT